LPRVGESAGRLDALAEHLPSLSSLEPASNRERTAALRKQFFFTLPYGPVAEAFKFKFKSV
jgi:hypothetical protein